MKSKITPVLLGADLNCYNVARAFHEQYGVTSYAFGRYAVSATKYSKIVNFTQIADIDSEATALRTLRDFADKHKGECLVLFGCTDDYATLAARLRDRLPEYIIPYPDAALQPIISKKAEFYEICDKYGIPYPDTVVTDKVMTSAELTAEKLGFKYPIIIKPSCSVTYWKHSFDGMKKVYTANDPSDAEKILREIFASGYDNKIILQEMIDGGDSQMRVFTAFSDKNGKVRAMCLGHTMLEEHTPKGLGNHAAIVTEPVSEFPLAEKLRRMLEDMGYTGFSNFDIKLREGTKDDFRVFEINLRQGRSNYYVTSAGLNVARLAAELYIDDGDSFEGCERAHFWHHVPKSVAYKYTEDKELVKRAKTLAKEGKESSSVWYPADFKGNLLRFICAAEQLRRQKKKYKIYYPKSK